MVTSFPTGLDSFYNPSATNYLDDANYVHHVEHSNINDSVAALETKVGINSSAVTTTIDYIINHNLVPYT